MFLARIKHKNWVINIIQHNIVLLSVISVSLTIQLSCAYSISSYSKDYAFTKNNHGASVKKSYFKYKVLRTDFIGDSAVVKELLGLDGMRDIEFWKYPVLNRSADILASPSKVKYVQKVLSKVGLKSEVIINDAQNLIWREDKKELDEYGADEIIDQKSDGTMNWLSYQRYNVISQWCQSHALRDPLVSTQVIGKSTEGRDIHMIKLSMGNSENKSAIFLDGGMHAREWISPATVTYIMNKLITNSSKHHLIEKFDWYFVPVVNVDGYEFTHTVDRFWRKTRSMDPSSHGCVGVDPNRNWDFHWKEAGSSTNPCSPTYHGSRPFSEPETAALSKTIMGLKDQIKLYLTFHSYSQMWLVPWSHSKKIKPDDYQDLLSLGKKGKLALERTYKTQYKIGTAPDLLYAAAGGSDDWVKGAAGVKYSYTVELRDKGRFGFALPASQIVETGEETFNGVEAAALELYNRLDINTSVENSTVKKN